MIRNFTHIFTGILFLVLSNFAFANEVKLEVKKVDDGIIMVFYHDRWNILTPSMVGNQGRIRSEKPAELKYISDASKIVSSIKSTSKNVIDFKLKSEYKFVGNVYGENLVAFKLKQIKQDKAKVETKLTKEQAQKITTSDTSARIVDNKNTKQINFPFDENDIGAAIFRRGNNLWVVFDKRKDFFLPKTSFIDSYFQFSDPYNTILKITLKRNLYPKISKNGRNWVLGLSDSKPKLKTSLKAETLSESLVSIKDIGKISNIVTVRDSAVGDVIKIIPTKSSGQAIVKEESKLDYKILESGQGVAISLVSDQVKTTYNEKSESLDIISTYALGQSIAGGDKIIPSEPLLPFNLKEIDEASYLQTKEYFQNNLLLANGDEAKAEAIYDLAKFYFTHKMHHESLGMLRQIGKFSEKLSKGKEQMLMQAISMTIANQELDARDVYTELKQNFAYDPYIHEIELWDRLNEFQLGNKPSDIIADSRNLVDLYPENIHWSFIFAELDVLASKKDSKAMDAVMKSVRRSKDVSTNNQIKFYKAKYFYILSQINLAQNILEEVKQTAVNGKEYLMAELQLVKILYEQKRLDWITAVQRLNSLRFVWRGDKYEHQLLMASAMAYQQNNDVINAIRTYKYILEAFGKHSENNFFVTQQIVDLYRRIFLSNEMQELDDFSVVALFYEFKDYTPIGVDGDRVVLGIARRMLNLDLLEMAGSILEHQVMYRLRGTERMVTANHLALVLLMDRKPHEALNVLNDTDNENFGFTQHQKRTLLKAKALIDMEKYDDALSYIGNEEDADAALLKSEILFRSFHWADFIKFIEPKVKAKLKEGDVIEGEAGQEVLRLAIAYSMLNRINDLGYLQQNLLTENTELKKILEFLKSSNAPIDPHNIDKMIGIDTMQNFLDNYRKLLFK